MKSRSGSSFRCERRWSHDDMTAARMLYGEFVRTFGNVLFAVSLFVVWGVLTLIGVIVDQGQDPNLYFQTYARRSRARFCGSTSTTSTTRRGTSASSA